MGPTERLYLPQTGTPLARARAHGVSLPSDVALPGHPQDLALLPHLRRAQLEHGLTRRWMERPLEQYADLLEGEGETETLSDLERWGCLLRARTDLP